MAETFQTFTGRRIVGRKWFIAAMVLVALQSFVVWMHHMFLTSINLEIKTLFMVTTIGISLPFDLMVFSLIYTMVKGRIRFTTPFLFSFGGAVAVHRRRHYGGCFWAPSSSTTSSAARTGWSPTSTT